MPLVTRGTSHRNHHGQDSHSARDEDRSNIRTEQPYDEVDARLMDTFPASDAVARY